MGVDLFFVISGFIMIYVTVNTQSGIRSSIKFLINRLIRVLPIYYLVLIFAFLTDGAMSLFHYPEKVSNLVSALTFSPYLDHPAPLYIPSDGMFNIRWTLNYEIYFYLAVSISLLYKNKVFPLFIWFLAPIALCYLFLSQVTFSTQGYLFHSVFIKFLTNPIILEFGIGCLTAYTYLFLKQKNFFTYTLLPILCFLAVVGGVTTGILSAYNLMSALALALLLLFFTLNDQRLSKFIPKWLITTGNASYSLYLLHIPLRKCIGDRIENLYPGTTHSVIGFISILAFTVMVSILFHHYIEIKLVGKIRAYIEKYLPYLNKQNT